MKLRGEPLHDYVGHCVRRNPSSVCVRVSHRIHLGAIDLSDTPAVGGGVGFGVPELSCRVVVSRQAQAESVPLDAFLNMRVLCAAAVHMGLKVEGISWSVEGSVYRHLGLGSTTQLQVAALQGLRILSDLEPADVPTLAAVGIGAQSSMGVRLALDPTPAIDFGRSSLRTAFDGTDVRNAMSMALRFRFPPGWQAVVLVPEVLRGPDGAADEAFWTGLLPLPGSRSESAAHALLLGMMKGVAERDLGHFNNGLAAYNRAGAKPEEWLMQAAPVHALAGALRAEGMVPALSSVGPSLVVFVDAGRVPHVMDIVRRDAGWRPVVTRGEWSREP